MKRSTAPKLFSTLLAAAVLGASATVIRAQEGYDPMRVVYLQQAHPVLLITFDTSGSLAFPVQVDPELGTSNAQESFRATTTDYPGYYYYSWRWSGGATKPAGAGVHVYADESIDTSGDSTNQNFRTGQGEWIRAASMNGLVRTDIKNLLYVAGYWGWTAGTFTPYIPNNGTACTYATVSGGTMIDLWNMPNAADNGTYVLSSNPTQSAVHPYMQYFTVRKSLNNQNTQFECSDHIFSPGTTDYRRAMMALHGYPAQSVWYFAPPSRMTMLKNALGTSMSYYTPKASPTLQAGETVTPYTDSSQGYDKTYYVLTDRSGANLAWTSQAGPWGTQTGSGGGAFYDYAFGRIISGGTTLTGTSSNAGVAPDANYTVAVAPKNIVGKASGVVDWGLMTFGTSTSDDSSCSNQRINVISQAVANDSRSVQGWDGVTADGTGAIQPLSGVMLAILPKLGPVMQNGSIVGLNPFGGTPTKPALYGGATSAFTSLQATLNAELAAAQADSGSWCKRTYATLLVTDGQSNCGNAGTPSDSAWTACTQTETQLTTNELSAYPPGSANSLWTGLTVIPPGQTTAVPYPFRTYVIGVSDNVSPCELNWTAYYGRTDAYAADVGFNTDADTRLPAHDFDTGGVQAYPPHNYFFQSNTSDSFVSGMRKILATMGAGDYTTSPPVVITSLDSGKPYALLGSTEFTSLRGHLYAYDVSQPEHPKFVWDAGWRLSQNTYEGDDLNTPGTVANPNFANYSAADARKIYTWNPSSGALVAVTTANAATLDTIAGYSSPVFAKTATVTDSGGASQVTYPIIDFVRGKYWNSATGAYAERPWKLGAILNVTAAVLGSPENWAGQDAQLPDHSSFYSTYGSRHPLIYVGASDGMIHAFDLAEGYEVFALIPPNNLANQPALFYNFINGGNATGEPASYQNHIYGTSNSVRFTDVPICTGTGSNVTCTYKTMLFVTEGPGGNDTSKNSAASVPTSSSNPFAWPAWLADQPTASPPGAGWGTWTWPNSTRSRSAMYTVDVTHPYPGATYQAGPTWSNPVETLTYAADPNYDAATTPTDTLVSNVVPLGQVNSGMVISGTNQYVYQTWSVPAVGCYTTNTFGCTFGSGFNPTITASTQPTGSTPYWQPLSNLFNPASYNSTTKNMANVGSTALTYTASGVVGDQAFADAVFWQNALSFYTPGKMVNEIDQADLNGNIWRTLFNSSGNPSTQKLITVGAGNPIYYSPATGFYKDSSSNTFRLYAFGSGSFYETSPAVTGETACSSGGFCPRIFITAYDTTTPPSLPVTPATTNGGQAVMLNLRLHDLQLAEPNALGQTVLSSRAQLTASPILFLPDSSSSAAKPFAVFLIYDPGSGSCAGDSYVFDVAFDPGLGMGAPAAASMFHAAQGVAGGFATVAGSVIVSVSGFGGQRATVIKVPEITVGTGSGGRSPNWWIELK